MDKQDGFQNLINLGNFGNAGDTIILVEMIDAAFCERDTDAEETDGSSSFDPENSKYTVADVNAAFALMMSSRPPLTEEDTLAIKKIREKAEKDKGKAQANTDEQSQSASAAQDEGEAGEGEVGEQEEDEQEEDAEEYDGHSEHTHGEQSPAPIIKEQVEKAFCYQKLF